VNIFINYRRADSAEQAQRLFELLSRYLQKPEKQLYFDTETTPLGVDYGKLIADKIADCDVMLTLIGEHWLTVKNPGGEIARIHEDNDLVRKEIKTALISEKPIVPTMFEGAGFLKEDELPSEIGNLAWRNGVSIRSTNFKEDVKRLAEGLGLTRDNRKYGVFIAAQAPLLGYVVADEVRERHEDAKQANLPPPPPPIFANHEFGENSKEHLGAGANKKLWLWAGIAVLFLLGVAIALLRPSSVGPAPVIVMSANSGQTVTVGDEITLAGQLTNQGDGVIQAPEITVTRTQDNVLLKLQQAIPITSFLLQSKTLVEIPGSFQCENDVTVSKPCDFEFAPFELKKEMLDANGALILLASVSSESLSAESQINQTIVIEDIVDRPPSVEIVKTYGPKTGLKVGDQFDYQVEAKNISEETIPELTLLVPFALRTDPWICKNLAPGDTCKRLVPFRTTLGEKLLDGNWLVIPIEVTGEFEGSPLTDEIKVPVGDIKPRSDLSVSFDKGSARKGDRSTLTAKLSTIDPVTIRNAKIQFSGALNYVHNCGAIEPGTPCVYPVEVPLSQTGILTVNVTATGDNIDPNTASASIDVGEVLKPGITISGEFDQSSARIGDTIVFSGLLTNTGQTTLSNARMELTGSFIQSKNCGNLNVGEGCPLDVSIKLSENNVSGEKISLDLQGFSSETNTDTFRYTLPVGDKLWPKGDITGTLSPSSNLRVGQTVRLTTVLKNTGQAPLENGKIFISGDVSDSHVCSDVITVGGDCSHSTSFTITEAMRRNDGLNIQFLGEGSNLPSPARNSLNSQIEAAPKPVGELTARLSKPRARIGEQVSLDIQFRNIGDADLLNGQINISGSERSSKNCRTISKSKTCPYGGTFLVQEKHVRNGRVTFNIEATGSNLENKLTEQVSLEVLESPATAQLVAILSPNPVQVGSQLNFRAVLTNTGKTTLKNPEITITLLNDSETANCPDILLGKTCPINESFPVQSAMAPNGTLTLNFSAKATNLKDTLDTSRTVEVIEPDGSARVSGEFIDMGILGSYLFKSGLTNTGSIPLENATLTLSGDAVKTKSCGRLAPRATCTLDAETTFKKTPGTVTVVVTGTASNLSKPVRQPFTKEFLGVGTTFTDSTTENDGEEKALEYKWTPWGSYERPDASGDYETINIWQERGPGCAEPIAVQCRVLSTKVGWRKAGEVYTCNVKQGGGKCVNAQQPDGKCFDYEARYKCPVK